MEFKSNAKPSQFSYPPPMEEKKEKQAEKIETAVLSITAKAKKRQQEKSKQAEAEKMDVVSMNHAISCQRMMTITFQDTSDKTAEKKEKDKEKEKEKEKEKKDDEISNVSVSDKDKPKPEQKAEPEPNFQMLKNPARVMKQQVRTRPFLLPLVKVVPVCLHKRFVCFS